MNIRTILYFIITPLCIWCISSLNIDRFFRKNRTVQIITTYVLISMALSYLIVNFLMDFFLSTVTKF